MVYVCYFAIISVNMIRIVPFFNNLYCMYNIVVIVVAVVETNFNSIHFNLIIKGTV